VVVKKLDFISTYNERAKKVLVKSFLSRRISVGEKISQIYLKRSMNGETQNN
jgi:hypothetical protein